MKKTYNFRIKVEMCNDITVIKLKVTLNTITQSNLSEKCTNGRFNKPIRDRPFNLKGEAGLWFVVSFRIFFWTTQYLFILSRKARFNISLYDKNSESDYFFPSTKIRIFFSATLGIRIFF